PVKQTVSFAPGATTATVSIPVSNDTNKENDEYFSLRLSNPVNTFLGSELAHTVYILDNDRKADVATEAINLKHLTSVQIGVAGDDAAEIVDYDSASQKLFVSNSAANKIEVIDFSNPSAPVVGTAIDISSYGGINSVAVRNGVVAAAIENDDKVLPGFIVFFDTNGAFLSQVTAGALPDMITFSPDGSKVLTANEGEPNADYSSDPEGSISIVDISGGVANVTQANVTTAGFSSFNAQQAQLIADGVRIFGPGASVAQDLEPEYITLSANGDTAWVTCQENNALAVVDVNAGTVLSIVPLGYKNHATPTNGLDAEDRSDFIRIANYPVRGMYMPDAIASYQVGGSTFLVTANEGDAREYDTYAEEVRLSSGSYELDETIFPNADLIKANIGRLTVTTASGDTDGDGDFDEIHAFGGRSFSIWNGATGSLVYDSGDDMELIISQSPTWGPFFNSTNDELDLKNRSDNKGPEPEGVVVGQINQGYYAFIGLERMGGVMVYDITDPTAAIFVDYENTRDTASDGGDLAPEGLVLIPNTQSPDGKYYLIVANEVSSTVTIYEVEKALVGVEEELASLPMRIFPNPAVDGVQIELLDKQAGKVSVKLLTLEGREVLSHEAENGFAPVSLELSNLPAGIYLIDVMTDHGRAVQRLVIR
ncbi:MAG: choice-of-anchor I family protein, partial [Bacteroidia bacterium]|nr:choice-of-anchor I family protein [Bacteroidia bacterium]